MVSYDWANDGSVGVFRSVLLQGCREGCCEYGPATGISCWVDVLGETYLTRLSGLMDSRADSRSSDL